MFRTIGKRTIQNRLKISSYLYTTQKATTIKSTTQLVPSAATIRNTSRQYFSLSPHSQHQQQQQQQKRKFSTETETRGNTGTVAALLGGSIAVVSALLYFQNSLFPDELEDDDLDLPFITRETVASNNSRDSAWVVIDGKVYDITSLLDNHPGGDGILVSFAGKDVSKEFEAMRHSNFAREMAAGLLIGQVPPGQVIPKVVSLPANSPAKKNMVILGAGICGVSAAYFLTQCEEIQSEWNVTVIESAPLVGGTGLKSSAIMYLGPLLEKNDKDLSTEISSETVQPSMTLTQYLGEDAYDFFTVMQKEWNDIEFRNKGTVGVIEDDEQLEIANLIFGKGGRVKGAQIISDPDLIRKIEPSINPDQLKGIIYHERGATVDPYLVCHSFETRAENQGTQFLFNHTVKKLERIKNDGSKGSDTFRVHTVTSNEESRIDADVLVICTGWTAKDFAAQVDHNVPVKAMHGQMFAISCPDLKLNNNIYGLEGVTHWRKNRMKHQATRESEAPYKRITSHLYGVQLANGILKFGGDRILGDLNGKVLEDGIDDNYETVIRIFPQLKDVPILGSWSGTMPFTPDQKIICGELEENFFVLTGSGFMRGLASGKLLAQSIKKRHLKGKEGNIDSTTQYYLDQCTPKRFMEK